MGTLNTHRLRLVIGYECVNESTIGLFPLMGFEIHALCEMWDWPCKFEKKLGLGFTFGGM